MLVGHLGVGVLVKRVEPRISLGALILAAVLPDILCALFMLAGLERVTFGAGLGAGNYFQPVDIALSHSLLLGAVWAGILGLAYAWRSRWPRGAWVLVVVVLSHWVLDVLSHRPDMPLAPATSTRLGFGLWTSVPATIVIEGGVWAIAVAVYAHATVATRRIGTYVFWAAAMLLTLAWYNNIAGPAPTKPRTAPIASLLLFVLAVLWAYWMDRLRVWRRGPLANKALHPTPAGGIMSRRG